MLTGPPMPARRRRVLASLTVLPYLAGIGATISSSLPEDDQGLTLLTTFTCLLVLTISAALLWRLLRRVTADLAVADEHLLDERELQERGRVYEASSVAVIYSLAPLLTLAVIDDVIRSWNLTASSFTHALLGALATAMLAPLAVSAWRRHDFEPE